MPLNERLERIEGDLERLEARVVQLLIVTAVIAVAHALPLVPFLK